MKEGGGVFVRLFGFRHKIIISLASCITIVNAKMHFIRTTEHIVALSIYDIKLNLFIPLIIYLSIYLSIYLYFYLYIYLSIYHIRTAPLLPGRTGSAE